MDYEYIYENIRVVEGCLDFNSDKDKSNYSLLLKKKGIWSEQLIKDMNIFNSTVHTLTIKEVYKTLNNFLANYFEHAKIRMPERYLDLLELLNKLFDIFNKWSNQADRLKRIVFSKTFPNDYPLKSLRLCFFKDLNKIKEMSSMHSVFFRPEKENLDLSIRFFLNESDKRKLKLLG